MHSFRQDILHFLQKSRPDIFSSAPHFAFFFHFLTTLWANKKAPQTNKFVCGAFGPSGENRTHGLLNPIVLLSKTQCTIRYCLDSVSLNFKCIISFCFIGCQDVSFLLWSNCGQTTPTNDFSPPAKLHRAISIFINRSCAFCLHELSIRRICQPCQ